MTRTKTPRPPVARRRPHRTKIHGETLQDDYFWLREKENPAVISYLEAENAYAEALMKPTKTLQQTLYREMVARIKETDDSAPYKEGAYLYYTRIEQGQQYRLYCRKPARRKSEAEQVTLDLNLMARGHTFMAVGDYEVSADARLLAYTTDTTGFREYTLRVKDLSTDKHLRTRVERVSSVCWAADNRTLFYVVDDPVTKRSSRLYRQRLGERRELVYEEPDEMFNLEVSLTRSRAFVLITSASHTTSEVRYVAARRPDDEPRLVEPREQGHEYYLEHRSDRFYIRTNEGGARNFKLVVAPVGEPARRNWRELVAHREDVMLNDVDLFADFLVRSELEGGLPVLRVTDLDADGEAATHSVAFPEPAYEAEVGINMEFRTRRLRFNYQSLVTPPSVYDYDMQTREHHLLKRTPVLSGFDPADYRSERIHALASDGTRIPVSLVYKKELRGESARPLLLAGYGAYGLNYPVTFSIPRLALLDRGLIYAIAHIRGGGEMGKRWHEEGRMMRKMNTFTDFIATAEFLINEGYTTPAQLVITGGSAGGLLMGAVVNMRPELFRAVDTHVPFVDVINTMLDESLPLTVGEYQEWGDPHEPEAYRYIKSYSPYDNVEAKDYPAMLVQTSLNDSQVMYWEPAKYVARLRALKTDTQPLLLKTNMGAGHGGASGRYDALKEDAFEYAFMLNQLGIEE
ncbi:MAG TPA: S9 family peptidase [Pyrinomonadaceae bacterium]|nr:S9 family peptidase [Pyrinomonadaceae bacterium]